MGLFELNRCCLPDLKDLGNRVEVSRNLFNTAVSALAVRNARASQYGLCWDWNCSMKSIVSRLTLFVRFPSPPNAFILWRRSVQGVFRS